MRYLLDTNALINEMFNPIKLSDEAKNAIEIGNEVYISVAALWEIGIKQSINKLDINATTEEIADECKRQDIKIIRKDIYLVIFLENKQTLRRL